MRADPQVMEAQRILNARAAYHLNVDGIAGKKTMDAVDKELSAAKVDIHPWSDARRQLAFMQLVMRDANIEVGSIDGLIGEQTRYALEVYAARRANGGKPDPKVENWRDDEQPTPIKPVSDGHPSTRWPTQKNVPSFYGATGQNQVMLDLPFPMRIAWEPAKSIGRISCHKKVAPAMGRIWKNVLDHYGYEQIKKLRLDMFGGCLNVRRMRGGSSWSMHSWGIAMDVDPDRNQLKMHRAQAELDDPQYKQYWEFVYAEGAIGLGPERDYDWMHFQFSRL